MSEHDNEDEGGGTVTPIRETREISPAEYVLNILDSAAEKTRGVANFLDFTVAQAENLRGQLEEREVPVARGSVPRILLISVATMAMVAGLTTAYLGGIVAGNKRRRESEIPGSEVKAPETFSGRLGLVARLIVREARDQVVGAGSAAIAAWRILRAGNGADHGNGY